LYYVAALKQGGSSRRDWKFKSFMDRVDLDADDGDEGKASIGTPNGLGTAWAPIQHKERPWHEENI
jgi:hypothetical protein